MVTGRYSSAPGRLRIVQPVGCTTSSPLLICNYEVAYVNGSHRENNSSACTAKTRLARPFRFNRVWQLVWHALQRSIRARSHHDRRNRPYHRQPGSRQLQKPYEGIPFEIKIEQM